MNMEEKIQLIEEGTLEVIDTEELKEVLDNDHLRTVLKRYPGYKLPIKRALYFYCMKYRLVRLVLLLGQKG